MNLSWSKFYESRLDENYYRYICKRYSPFIEEIKQLLRPRDVVVELGCGIGSITRAVLDSKPLCKFRCTDINQEMLRLTAKNKLKNRVLFYQIDMTQDYSLPAKVAFSHGVLEHLSNQQIRDAINIQKKQYKYLIHYVPSYKYVTQSFGDERLLRSEQWSAICQPDEIIEFNDGYDLILKWCN
jgi:SAM-dependent methyltransferase